MQISAFTITNYRSIIKAKRIGLSNYSVLIGANNQGKSNILNAFVLGLRVSENSKYFISQDSSGRFVSVRGFGPRRADYDWERDFPITKQNRSSEKSATEIAFDFKFSDSEIIEFQERVGSNLNGTLPLVVRFNKTGVEISIQKQGRGGGLLNKKKNRITSFVSERLTFDYVPAVRTSDITDRIFSDLVSRELNILHSDENYRKALEKISELQEPILQKLSSSITETISSFIPSVKSVGIRLAAESGLRATRRDLGRKLINGWPGFPDMGNRDSSSFSGALRWAATT